jgi:hypothetical protein
VNSRRVLRLLAASAPLIASHALADDGPYASPMDDRFRLTAGAFLASTTTTLRLDGAVPQSGTLVSAEDDLGLERRNALPDLEIMVGVRERHRVRLNFFKLDRSAAQPLVRQLQIRGDTYNVDDFVESNFDVRMFAVTYAYSFLHKPRIDLAGSFGVNVMDVHARALIRARGVDQSKDAAGAFPTVGIDATALLSRRFYLEARAEYLKASIQDFDGSAENLHFGLVYRWQENLAIGIGYRKFKVDLTSNQTGDTGQFGLDNSGPQAFIRASF